MVAFKYANRISMSTSFYGNSNDGAVTILKIVTVKMCLNLPLTASLDLVKIKFNYANRRLWYTLCLFTIAMFVASVTFCRINTYEYSNILDSNSWPWKLRSMMLTIRMEIGCEGTLSTNIRIQTLALLVPAVCSECIAVHLVKDERAQGRTDQYNYSVG